jgi:hypothetical protein
MIPLSCPQTSINPFTELQYANFSLVNAVFSFTFNLLNLDQPTTFFQYYAYLTVLQQIF